MMSKAKFKSDASEAIHRAADGLYRAGAIDKTTLRGFDESCLSMLPTTIAPKQIKRIREKGPRQPTGLCALLEHQRVHRAEMGSRHEAA
jgi:DNA-binding transcriptional regulator YiaG